jgi:hypothetical protein
MKRLLLIGTIVMGVGSSALTAVAGGCHGGGGWCGGGGWHGSGGGGWCGSGWSFSLGIGFGASYPAYSYPAYYPAYNYAYAPAPVTYSYVQPTYAYRTVYAQPSTVVTTTRATPATTAPAYGIAKTAPSSTAPQRLASATAVTPVQARAQSAAAPKNFPPPKATASSGTWVLDKNPYVYNPPPPATQPNGTAPQNPSFLVSRTSDSVPIYVVSR